MISLNYIWIPHCILIRPYLKEVIICDLLLSGGPGVMIVDFSVAHLLIVNHHLRVNIKYVLQLIWILNGLRRLLIGSLSLFNLLGTSSDRRFPLLRLLVLLLALLLVDYRHFGVSRALKDTTPVAIFLWNARVVLSIILELWTEQVDNFIFIIFRCHEHHLMSPNHLFFLLLWYYLIRRHLIRHLSVKFIIMMIRLCIQVPISCLLWNITV